MGGIDTSGLVVVSHLVRNEELRLPDSLVVRDSGGVRYLAPNVEVAREGMDSFRIVLRHGLTGAAGDGSKGVIGVDGSTGRTGGDESGGVKVWYIGRGDVVLYWNRKRFLSLF